VILVALLAGVYVLFAVAVMLLQRRLIYFPTRLSPRLADTLAGKEGLRPWHNPAGTGIGWLLPSRGAATGAALIVHGNAGCAIDRTYLAQPLHDADSLDVYILEYPGYGARPGAPSKASLLAAGEEAFGLLPSGVPIYLVSESLGTGVAAHLAKMNPARVSGMMLFVPYDRLASVGGRQMPFLPVSWMLWDRFEPARWLKEYHGRVEVVLASEDQIIPPDIGRRLYDSYGGPKRLQVIPGAGHNDVVSQSTAWWKESLRFLSEVK
jgi:pimeloyl-ACP methyl ester carboxylesterase